MNCISYSIFGAKTSYENCFPATSYIRGLGINIRMAEVLYPGWEVCVSVDNSIMNSHYGAYFDKLRADGKIKLHVNESAPLCEMMLWRLRPLFEMSNVRGHLYNRIICRDADSLLTYRDRQAVAYWEQGPKMAHAITDSVSHNIALMGGMIGFMSGPFMNRMGVKSFDELLALAHGIDFNRKGADQIFLNQYVLPKVADSITEHYCLGMPQSFRGDCHHQIQDIPVSCLELDTDVLKETNALGFHIGASGFQTDGTVAWLEKYGVNKEYWSEIEKQYSSIFYWRI